MQFKKLSTPSLKELFVSELESKILSGELKVGEKLPSERELAEAMQVSRAVVNSGIAEMEQKGFLIVRPRVGTFVEDYRKNGTLYGGDPEVEFVGDPRLKSGYGVYEKPIIDVAENFKNGIKNITGSNLDSILKIVSNGIPVQVWASINLRNTYVCAKWKSTSTNRYVEWKCGLHSLVIIGYTYDKIITSDPYTGNIEYYSKTQFEKMYNTYGKRAIYYES